MAVITNLMVNGTNYCISDASAVPQMRTVNNKSLTTDIVLDYSDIGIQIMTNSEIDEIVEA